MKKIDVIQPVAMATPFAEGVYSETSTDDFEIPAATSTAADDSCVLDNGFLPITSTALDDGGIAPERKNFNGMFYLSTDQRFYIQNGGIITFSQDVSDKIGGYPQDAILDYIDSTGTYSKVKSLIDNNTYNFNSDASYIDDAHWRLISFASSSSSLILGSTLWSPYPLIDQRLHPADGSQYATNGIYEEFVEGFLAPLQASSPDSFLSDADWQQEYATHGRCGKWVLDTENNLFRFPKIVGFAEGTDDITKLGESVDASVPNITGEFAPVNAVGYPPYGAGAFYLSSTSTVADASNGADTAGVIGFDASRSSSVYNDSTRTVQPASVLGFWYIVVATSPKTETQVNIDNYTTDLALKADTDLANVPASKGILLESYVNGTSWYRVYSDGWCVQGGSTTAKTSGVYINLLKPYTSTNYTLIVNGSGSTYNVNFVGAKASSSTIILYSNNSTAFNADWVTCGYIDIQGGENGN